MPDEVTRATRECLDTLDDAAFGAATPVKPKSLSPSDPAARLTAATGDRAFFPCSTDFLVDLDNAIIVDVAATAPIRQVETGAVQSMIEPVYDRFGIDPETLVADTADGAPEMLGWLVWTPCLVALTPLRAGLWLHDANRPPLRCKMLCRAKKANCGACALKPRWLPEGADAQGHARLLTRMLPCGESGNRLQTVRSFSKGR